MFGKGLNLDQAPPLMLPMRFFLTAPLFGIAAGLLLVWRGGAIMQIPLATETVALVHLLTLGVITMVMLGALYQIVPVLVGALVPGVGTVWMVHGGLTLGLVAMEGGMLLRVPWLLWTAFGLMALAFLVFALQMALALRRTFSKSPTTVSIALAIASLFTAASLGLLFLGEYASRWLSLDREAMTATHAYLAMGGWVFPLITGVAYAVIPMFYLGSAFPARRGWLVLGCQAGTVGAGISVVMLAPGPAWHLLPVALAGVGVGVFALTTWRALQQRRRRISDTTLRFWQGSLAAAPLALAALAGHALQPHPRWLMVFAGLFLVGFATAAINGMLYKIVPFLVWLHRFSKLAGKVQIPLLKDIVSTRQTTWQWRLYLVMLALLVLALATGDDLAARLAGLAMVAAFGMLQTILVGAARFSPDPEQMKPLVRVEREPIARKSSELDG